ncbi:hypothetical protein E3Q18_00784 [Wallemia mellicola]|nr:hypothetical protein E3Q18_00784 [Wallemia mellicola]
MQEKRAKEQNVIQPTLKRGQACLSCRKLKLRCSADKPTCRHCYKTRRECVYDSPEAQEIIRLLKAQQQTENAAATQRAVFYRHNPPGTSIQSFITQAPQTAPNAAMSTGQSRASPSYANYGQHHVQHYGQQYLPGAHVGDSYVIRHEEATLFDQNLHALIPQAEVQGADLYAGQDLSGLNLLEKAWVNWYIWWGNPVIATGVMSFLMHEVVYFGRSIPWIIIDHIPYFRQWKLQPHKIPSDWDQWRCTYLVLLQHFTIELPQIWGFHPLAEYFGMLTYQVPFPSVWQMAKQIAIFFVFEDTWHFVFHRALHWGPLYKRIHKQHHEFSAPFGLAAEYAHPIEVGLTGFGTVGAPILYAAFLGEIHIVGVYLWITCRLFQAIDSHSGYHFPWSLNNFLPFWAGAEHHDYHHEKFTECYSSSFRHWDWLFGTDKKYHAYRAKQAAQKKAKKAQYLAANRSRRKTASVDLYNSKTGGTTQGSARKSKKRNLNPKRVSIHDIDFNQSLIQSPVVDRLHHSIIEQRVPTPTLAERASTLKTLAQDALSFLLSPVATKSDPVVQRRWETFESFKSSTFTSGNFISIDQVLRGQNRTSETAMTIAHGIRMSNITAFAYIINHQSATVDSNGEISPSINLKEAWQSFLPFIIPESNKVHKRHVDMLIELGTQVYNLKQLIVSHTQKQSDASRLQAESVKELKLELFNFKATFKNVDKKKLSNKIETHFLKKAKDRAQSILRLPVESLNNEYPYEEFKDLMFNYVNSIWDQDGSNIAGSPGNASPHGSSVEDEELTDVLNVSRLLQPDQSQGAMEHHTQPHPIGDTSNMPHLLSGDDQNLHNEIDVNLDLDSHIDNVNGSIFSEQQSQSVAHLKDFFDEPPQGESTFFLHSTPDRRSHLGDFTEDPLREGSISLRSEGRGPINIEHLLNHQHHVSTDAVINANDVFGDNATDAQTIPHLSDGSSSHNRSSDQSISPNNQTVSSSSSSDTSNTKLREARDGVLGDMADILGGNIKDQSLLLQSRQTGNDHDGNTGVSTTRTSSSMPPPSNSQKNLDKRISLQSLNTATPTLKYIKEKIGGRTRQSKRLALITEQAQDGVIEEAELRHQPLSQVIDAPSHVDVQLKGTEQRKVNQEGMQREVEEAQRGEANEIQKRRDNEARNKEIEEEQQRLSNERREAEEEEVRLRLEQQRQSEEERIRHEEHHERDRQAKDEIRRQAEAEQLGVAQESEQAKIQNQLESSVDNSPVDVSEEPHAELFPETVGPSDYWNQINEDPLPFASEDYAIMEAAEGSDNGGMGRRPSLMSWVGGSSDNTPTSRQRTTEKHGRPLDTSSPSGTYGQPRIIARKSVKLSNNYRSPTRRASRRNKKAYDGSSEEENNVVLQSPNQGVGTQDNRASVTTNPEEKLIVRDITAKKISKEIIEISSESDDEVYEKRGEEKENDNDHDADDRNAVESQAPSQYVPSSPSSRRASSDVSQNQQRKQKNVRLVTDSESDEEEDEQTEIDQHNRVKARQARQRIERKKAEYGFSAFSQMEKDNYVRTKGLSKTNRPQLSQRETTNSGRRVRVPMRAYESDLIIRYVINEYRLARKYGSHAMYGMYSRMITDHGWGGRYSQILQDRHNVDIKDYVFKYSSNKLNNMEKLHPAFRTTYGCQDAASYMFYDDTDSEEEADGMKATNQTQIKREVQRRFGSVAELVQRLTPGASTQRIPSIPPQTHVTDSNNDVDYEEVDQLASVEPHERSDRLRTVTSNARSGTKRPRSLQEFNETNEEYTEAPPVRGKRRAIPVGRNTGNGD